MNQINSNIIMLKKLNIDHIKKALIEMEYGTKLTIAKATGLSVATCGNILNELLKRGEVIEMDTAESNGGRPAKRFIYNMNFRYVACMYLIYDCDRKEHNITYVVSNLAGERLEEKTEKFDHINYETIEKLTDRLIKKYPLIKSVGVGIPGVVNDGLILSDCDIENLNSFPLKDKLKKGFPVKVVIENDMNLQTLGFYRQLEYDEAKNIVLINFPKNKCIGSGIIVEGHILKGNTNFAGELSYLPFGMTQAEQIKQFNSPESMMPLVIRTITSIIPIINPDTIALTGELIQAEILENIIEECSKIIPKEHMPKIIVRKNTEDDYINGLLFATTESLSCDIKLVRKRI